MRFTLKRRPQASHCTKAFTDTQQVPSAVLLPDVLFHPMSRRLRRRIGCACTRSPLMILLAAAAFIAALLALPAVLRMLFPSSALPTAASFFDYFSFRTVPVRVPLPPSLPVALAHVGSGSPVTLIVPIIHQAASLVSASELLRELLSPLLLSETALCHRADDGAGVAAVVHAVVMSRVSAAAVGAAVRDVVAAGRAVEGEAVGDGGAGGELTPGARWRAWELSVAAVRGVLGVSDGGGDGGAARCLSDVVTVVGHAMEGGGAVYSEEPADTLEVLVDAALRTRGGSAGSHFIVLPSFLGASRMAYTEPGDVAEVRRAGTGLVDALLRTATTRNGGRVAAAQCTILGQVNGSAQREAAEAPVYVPEKLSIEDLRFLHVVDKGGLTASAHLNQSLQPFLTRRFSGYMAHDQRVSWEEVVDAASLHCGIFSRTLYNATGGFAAVRADPYMRHALKNIRVMDKELQDNYALTAPDRGGWLLSLRMQEMYPEWQVWGSRGVAVLRDSSVARGPQRTAQGVYQPALSMWDAYGYSVYYTTARLQRQRVGVSWSQRGLLNATRKWTAAEAALLPPVFQYYTDFMDPCCGLNREAMSYIRPLMERYSVRVLGVRRHCPKAGDVLLAAAYSALDDKLWRNASSTVTAFFRQRFAARGRINFQHWRAYEYRWSLLGAKNDAPTISVGRSLSELSNIPVDWVAPLRFRVNEVWTTADFFTTIYRRNGIDPRKIRVVPEAVDVYDYDPANYQRRPVVVGAEGSDGFDSQPGLSTAERMQRYVFFANFKWEDRKGWDVLLGAYWDAFGPGAPPELRGRATLVIKTRFEAAFARGVTIDNLVEFVEAWGKLGSLPGLVSIADYPHLVVLSASMSSAAVTQLYASADAFVFPSKAEGWGLPATEAMAMGLPVLLTDWGGMRRFMTPDTCFRIPLDGLKEIEAGSPYGYAEGMKMAVPSREKTAELMRYVLRHPEHAQRVGRRARELIVREMSEEAVADTMDRLFIDALLRKAQS